MSATHLQQTFDHAVRLHQAGRLAEAETGYRQVLRQAPNHAETLHLLGVIAHQVGRNDMAVDLIRRAISIKPDYAEAHYNLGNALNGDLRLDEAIAAYSHAVAINSGLAEAFGNLGNALRKRGRLDDAIASYRRAIAIKPGYCEAHNNLAIALSDKGLLDDAIAACCQAIRLDPGFAEAHANLGAVLRANGRLDEAVAACRRATALKPDCAETHCNLGIALHDKGLPEEAIAACLQAVRLKPDYAEAHYNLGVALTSKGRLDEAVLAYRRAIAARPNYAESHYNLGNALCNKERLDEGIAACRQAIAIKPDYAEAHYNLALALLQQGSFTQGWSEHEWRWRTKGFPSPCRNFSQPQWDGSDLAGRTILLHAEQGLGDTIQFARYAPLVAARSGMVLFMCPSALRRVLQRTAGVSQWFSPGESLPAFDTHCPLLSLPLAFGTTLQTIPRSVPYLHADPENVERWKERLAESSHGYTVGVAWAGHPSHHNDRNRSMTLAALAPLARATDVTFYSLQKGEAGNEAKNPPAGMNLIDRSEDLNDFADTAALIANLDLVISVDTAVVHLAAAMGKPVWTLLPFAPDWRWLQERNDSPWYPTMRLFRQPARGDWASVVTRVADELSRLVAGQ